MDIRTFAVVAFLAFLFWRHGPSVDLDAVFKGAAFGFWIVLALLIVGLVKWVRARWTQSRSTESATKR
jgi:Kef-type K+ transport system membrane component KefB